MDYPLSQAEELDLYQGRFTNGEPGVRPASIIPAETTNAIIDEITAVIAAAGITPDENQSTQLIEALTEIFAPLISPAFTGIPEAPTAPAGDSSEQLANTEFVQTAIAVSMVPKYQLYFMGQI